MRKGLLLAAICLWLGGCVGNPVQHVYSGPDAGALVFSSQTVGAPDFFGFWYKPVGAKRNPITFGGDGLVDHNPKSSFNRRQDFRGQESGWVTVRYLKPGDYEIYQYMLAEIGGTSFDVQEYQGTYYAVMSPDVQLVWAPADFSLRFRIEPGKATYVGSFSMLRPGGSNALLGILDRHERDLGIAHKADPGLPPVTIAVPDVASAGIPRLAAGEP